MLRVEKSLAFAIALAVAGCADVNSVVGGVCAEGYVDMGNACVLAPTSITGDGGVNNSDGSNNDSDGSNPNADGGTTSDGSTSNTDGSSTTADGSSTTSTQDLTDDVCPTPEVKCSGVCVDESNDPNNCGSCGHVCPSNSCVLGKCDGSAPGHVVVIGHDYGTSPTIGSSQARILSNATLMPASNPLRVMSYEQYASSTAVGHAETLVNAEAKLLGRSVAFVATSSASTVSSDINITSYDVLMIHDQSSAASGTLASIGSTWASDGNIATFLHGGGIVVVLSGGTGTGEMPALVTNASLLTVSSQTSASGSFSVLAPADAVGTGVIGPYVAKPSTVLFDTEANGGNVVWVVAQSGAPVVVHKVMP